jgi:predicted metal-binding protein
VAVSVSVDGRVLLRCHSYPDQRYGEEPHCPTSKVLGSLGSGFADLYAQAVAEGECRECGAPAYSVRGMRGLLCLVHLVDAMGLPRALLFEEHARGER